MSPGQSLSSYLKSCPIGYPKIEGTACRRFALSSKKLSGGASPWPGEGKINDVSYSLPFTFILPKHRGNSKNTCVAFAERAAWYLVFVAGEDAEELLGTTDGEHFERKSGNGIHIGAGDLCVKEH